MSYFLVHLSCKPANGFNERKEDVGKYRHKSNTYETNNIVSYQRSWAVCCILISSSLSLTGAHWTARSFTDLS